MMKNHLKTMLSTALLMQVALAGAAFAEDAKPLAGQHLSVLLPPWGTLPKEMTDAFTARTGVTLYTQTLCWDDIHTKIVTSTVAGSAASAGFCLAATVKTRLARGRSRNFDSQTMSTRCGRLARHS